MSLKINREILLILAVFFMVIMIPASFAGDVNDTGVISESGDDVIHTSSVNSNDMNLSSCESGDVLSTTGDFETTPAQTSVDYTRGESTSVRVNIYFDSYAKSDLNGANLKLYAQINDNEKVQITSASAYSSSYFNYDINQINDKLNDGVNTIKFITDTDTVEYYGYQCVYNPLTENVISSSSDDSDIYVDGSVSVTGSGTESSPYKTIGEAITKANSLEESTIHIAKGTYEEHDFILKNSTTIVGSGADEVIIDAKQSGHIFDIRGTNIEVTIKNLTLQNADVSGKTAADRFGGAIKAGFTGTTTTAYAVITLNLDSVKFNNNKAYQGGAIYISKGQLSGNSKSVNYLNIKNCEFNENIATYHAGAIAIESNANITNTVFDGNKLEPTGSNTGSNYGGAIRMFQTYSSLEITNCLFEKNTANGRGGAIFLSGVSNAVINYNSFIDNTASGTAGSNGAFVDYAVSAAVTSGSSTAGKNTDLNYNWWGYNDVNFTKEVTPSAFTISIYAQLNLSANPTEIKTGDESAVTTSFKWNDDTTDNIDKLPKRTVTLTTDATLSKTNGDVGLSSVFTATDAGEYNITAKVDNEELNVTVNVTSKEIGEIEGDWYVATADNGGSDSNDGKSRETPFLTIKKAIDSASDNNIIVVLEGEYSISTGISVSNPGKNLTISGEGEVLLTKSNNGYYFSFGGAKTYTLKGLTFSGNKNSAFGATAVNIAASTTNINFIECNFINNDGGTVVKVYGVSTFIKCNFINNKATGTMATAKGIIDQYGGTSLTVNYCNFINNDYSASGVGIYSNANTATGNINYNFWGSNEKPSEDIATSNRYILNDWIVIDSSIASDIVYVDNEYFVSATFKSTNDGLTFSNLTESMPSIDINVVPTIGSVTPTTVTISNNIGNTIYSSEDSGNEIINFNLNGNTVTSMEFEVEELDDGSKIYVSSTGSDDTGNGSNENPYATIEKALNENSLLGGGKTIYIAEGIYNLADYNLADDVIVIGRGNVLIKSESGKNHLTINNVNVNLTNLIFVNGTGSINIAGGDKKINITGCSFINNVASAATIIANGDVTIKGTSFINNTNTGSQGIIDVLSGSIDVSYSSFINNVYSDLIITSAVSGTVNNNFWGSNEKGKVSGSLTLTDYVIVEASVNNPVTGDNELIIKFKLNDGSDLEESMPEATFNLNAVNGTVSETVTLKDNNGIATYSSQIECSDNVTVSAYGEEITSVAFAVEENEDGKIFVDASFTGTSDGSKANPYTTIKAALDESKKRDGLWEIIIFDGYYSDLTSSYSLTKNTILTARGSNVIINNLYQITISSYDLTVNSIEFTGTSGTYNAMFYSSTSSGNATLKIINSSFVGITAKQLIDVGRVNVYLEKVNILNSEFTGTTTSAYPIRVQNNNVELNIKYSNFINNNYKTSFMIMTSTEKVTADNNYWGSNNKPTGSLLSPYVLSKVNNWVVLIPSINDTEINLDSTYNLSFVFKSTADGETFTNLEDVMPTVSFELISTLENTLNPATITLTDNTATATYTTVSSGNEVINITHGAAVANLTFNVKPDTVEVDISASDITMTYGGDDTLDVTITVEGEALADLQVAVKINDTEIENLTTDENGKISIPLSNLASNTYQINITVNTQEYSGSKSVNVIIKKAQTTLKTNETLVLTADDEKTIEYTLTPSDAGSVSYTITNDTVAVIEDGVIKALSAGTATITISFAENENYTGSEATITLTVNLINTTLTANPTVSLNVSQTSSIEETHTPAELNVNYVSNNTSVVTVDSDGNINAVKEGVATITLTIGDGVKYAFNTTNITVTVTRIATSIDVNDTITLTVSDEININATLNPGDAGSLSYSIDDESIISIENGIIKGLRAGTTTVTVSFDETDKYLPSSVTVSVTVNLINTSLSAESTTLELSIDDTTTITPTVTPAGLTVNYESNNSSVATVDNDGNVVAVNEGAATITLTIGDDITYTRKTLNITVNVSKIATNIVVDKTSVSLNASYSESITATLSPEIETDLIYTSSNTSVATVDSNGLIKAVGKGTAVITISYNGNEKYSPSNATVTVDVGLLDSQISVDVENINVTQDAVVQINITDKTTGNINITVKNRDGEIVKTVNITVSEAENYPISDLAVGEYNVTVIYYGDNSYKPSENTTSFVVSLISTQITVNNTLEINVTGNGTIYPTITPSELTPIFTTNNDSIAVVDVNGLVTGVSQGIVNITVKVGDGSVYEISEVNVTVSVSKIATTVSVEEDSISLDVGGNASIIADVLPKSVTNALVYSSNDTLVAVVDSDGVVTAVGRGSALITVKYDEDDTFLESSATVLVSVSLVETSLDVDSALNVGVGGNASVGYVVSPVDAPVIFLTNDEYIAVVDVNGLVRGISSGIVNITVRVGDGSVYEIREKNITVNVTKIATSISVGETDISLDIGSNKTVTPVVSHEDIKNGIIYDSSNPYVATVDMEGNIQAISEGTALITIRYPEDDRFLESTANITVKVNKINTEISIKADNITVGQDATVKINLPEDAEGIINITIRNDTVIHSVNITALNYTISNLAKGQYTVTVIYYGSEKYTQSSNETSFTVNLIETELNADLTLNVNVTQSVSINPTVKPENVNINYLSSNTSIATVDSEGIVTGISSGKATITITIGDNITYAVKSAEITVNVNKTATSIDISNPTVTLTAGESVNINATLNPADKSLTYTSDNPSVVNVDDTGKITALSAGTATVTVSFGGDDTYFESSATVTVAVNRMASEITVSEKDISLIIGENHNIIANLTPQEAGKIIYTSSNPSIVTVDDNGNIKAIANGAGTITLSFEGNDKYLPSNTTVSVTVGKKESNIKIAAEDISAGENPKITVTLPGDATGTVTVTFNGETSTVALNNLPEMNLFEDITLAGGSYSVSVTYNGDSQYLLSSTNTTFEVLTKSPSISVSVNDIKTGEMLVAVLILPGDVTGNVTLTVNGKDTIIVLSKDNILKTGSMLIATLTGNYSLNTGNYTLYATYNGNNYFSKATASDTFTVSKNTLRITATSKDVTVGDDVVITVNGLDKATGNVSAVVGGKTYSATIANSQAIITIADLTASNYTATVTFNGDDKYDIASATVSFKVIKISTYDINIKPDLSSVRNGTVDITLPDDAEGNVEITLANKTYTSNVVNGTSSAEIPVLDGADYTIDVKYSGDDKYSPNSKTVNVTVPDEVIITAPELSKYYSSKDRFIVYLTDSKHNILANKTLTISINGNNYTRTTNASGACGMNINLNSGEYDAVVSYAGDNIYPASAVTGKVTVRETVNGSDIVKIYRNGTQYYATFKDSAGNYLANGTVINFNINGVVYERRVNGYGGKARLNINLDHGNYTITAINTVTGENAANTITVLPVIVDNNDLVKYYRNASRFTAKIINGDGTPMSAGLAVKFNINGVVYTRYTTEGGNIGININLQPGEYTVTTEYNGCRVSNKITVLPVVSAADLTKKYGTASPFVATLVDGQGSPLVNTNVTFNINGVFYNRMTNATGQAKLNINLQAGEYIITSGYNGSGISNKVTVTN